jgi:hypothetical protein
MSKMTGKVYKSNMEIPHGAEAIEQEFRTSLFRPWALLFMEPIILVTAIYIAVIYGTLYTMFAAFPIVY